MIGIDVRHHKQVEAPLTRRQPLDALSKCLPGRAHSEIHEQLVPFLLGSPTEPESVALGRRQHPQPHAPSARVKVKASQSTSVACVATVSKACLISAGGSPGQRRNMSSRSEKLSVN